MEQFEHTNEEIEIDLLALFMVLRQKIVWILLSTVIIAGIAGGITKFMMTPIYSSSAQLYVLSKQEISQASDLTMGTQLTKDYMIIAKTPLVLDKVIKDLKLDMSHKELGEKVTVTNEADTRIMKITVADPDPEMAQKITQALTEVTAEMVSEKMNVKKPSIIANAYVAEHPDGPSTKKNTLIGALLGLMLACGIFTLQFLINDAIETEEDIERYLGIPVLAKLPRIEEKHGHRLKKRG